MTTTSLRIQKRLERLARREGVKVARRVRRAVERFLYIADGARNRRLSSR